MADAALTGLNSSEVASIYASQGERYVVSLVATYPDQDECEDAGVSTPHEAVAYALDLTRDLGSMSTQWCVFDRKTGRHHFIEQGDIPDIGNDFPLTPPDDSEEQR